MNDDSFVWLQNWYESQCDDDWEHSYGIKIETLDNPGWFITINLWETKLENCELEEVKIERSDDDWVSCFVKNGKFPGAGGYWNLLEIINIFSEWVKSKT